MVEPTDPASGLPLGPPTPEQVRDEMARELHRVLTVPRPPLAAPNPIATSHDAERILREALARAGGTLERPTKETLLRAADDLRGAGDMDGATEPRWDRIEDLIRRIR